MKLNKTAHKPRTKQISRTAQRPRRNRLILYAMALLQGMVFYSSIATLYRESRGVSLLQIGLIESLSFALLLVLEIPWGFVANRIGYKKTLVFCSLLYFASKLVFWRAEGFTMFLAERLMLSVVLAGLSGCDTGFLYENAGEADPKKVFGLYDALSMVGILFASTVFSLFIREDFAAAAFWTAVTYGIAALLSFFLQEREEDVARRGQKSMRSLLLAAGKALPDVLRLVPYLAAAALLSETGQFLTVFMSQIQYLASGIPLAAFGFLYALLTVAGMAGVFSSLLAKRVGEARLSLLLFAAASLACFALGLWQLPLLSVGALVLLRVATSLFVPLRLARQNAAVDSENRPLLLSMHSMAMSGVSAALNPLFGVAAQADVRHSMFLGGALCLAGLVLMALYLRRNAKPVKNV